MRFIVERASCIWAGNQRNQTRSQVFDAAMEQAHQLQKGKGNVQECERANTGATAAPELSVGQQRRRRRRATKEKLQREGRAACGYVDNPMRKDAGRQARRRRALVRQICNVRCEPPPAWAAKRAAGKQKRRATLRRRWGCSRRPRLQARGAEVHPCRAVRRQVHPHRASCNSYLLLL